MKIRDKSKPVRTENEVTEILTKEQVELKKQTQENVMTERIFQTLINLYNSVDSEMRANNHIPILQEAMKQAYNIIEEIKRK